MENQAIVVRLSGAADVDEVMSLAAVSNGYLGAYEGTEQPSQRVLDEGLSPRDRDVRPQGELQLYFLDRVSAEAFLLSARDLLQNLTVQMAPQENRDWNEEWRKHFRGVDILPYWSVRPTWVEDPNPAGRLIVLNPSTGFGSGSHPTTEMLLRKIGERGSLEGKRVLDFGSGSGILGIAAALMGADVVGVEIDPMAIEAAKEATDLNGVQIHFTDTLDLLSPQSFDFIVANILRNVLVRYADDLRRLVKPEGQIFLSGLLEDDIPDIQKAYRAKGVITTNGEWRTLDV